VTIFRRIRLRMRNVSNKIAQKTKIYILRPVTFFPENRAVYEIMSRNMADPERPQTIWRMRVPRWISTVTRTKAGASAHATTSTHSTHALIPAHAHTHPCWTVEPFINETEMCVDSDWNGKQVQELRVLVSQWSAAPASYWNGSVPLDRPSVRVGSTAEGR
jgi:hypothetical protein